MAITGGVFIFFFEEKRHSLLVCIFLGVSSVTCSGLSTLNLLHLSTPSVVAISVTTVLGSGVLLTLVPIYVRMHYLQSRIPPKLRTFNLSKFKRLPLWVRPVKQELDAASSQGPPMWRGLLSMLLPTPGARLTSPCLWP